MNKTYNLHLLNLRGKLCLVVINLLIFVLKISMSTRGLPQTKSKIEQVQAEAQRRNHELLTYVRGKNGTIPKQSYVGLRCLTCNNEWETKLYVYLSCGNSKSGGCRQCYNTNILDKEKYPNSPCLPKPDIADRPKRRAGKEAQRQAHLKGEFKDIGNRQQLKDYLKNHPNPHNNFALELIQRDEERRKNKISLKKGQFSKHHVIPLHAQGSPDAWNMETLTKAEHDQIHRLRYQVYGKIEDKQATYGTLSDLALSRPFPEAAAPELSPAKTKRELANLQKRTKETLRAIQEGMVWIHKDGYRVVILPEEVSTVKEILDQLIQALPVGHVDRKRMEQSSSSKIYVREHIHTVFSVSTERLSKCRYSAYNFVVKPYNQ